MAIDFELFLKIESLVDFYLLHKNYYQVYDTHTFSGKLKKKNPALVHQPVVSRALFKQFQELNI